jgi:drug/metabolite transporter (DMT)-like permease
MIRFDIVKRNYRISDGLAYLFLVIAPLCWAANVVLARGVVHIIAPVSLAFWRWLIAFLILLPFTWSGIKRDWKTAIQHWKILIALSILGISSFNTLLYTAVHTTTAINVALVQTAMPSMIILISRLFFCERIRNIQVVGVICCILGACLVVLRGSLHTFLKLSFVKGDLLMIAAVFLYALYCVLLRKRPRMHPMSFLTYTFGVGVLGLIPLYVWETATLGPVAFTREAAFSILFVAVFPSIVAYFCWNRGIEMIGASRAGLFINLVPVFASIMAILWLNESLEIFHVAGMTLIFGGMILFNR